MGKKRITYEYTHDGIKESILRHAKALRLPEGWGEQVAERVAKATDKWIDDKDIVTEDDLQNFICKELEEISPDIAFAYRNHDKII
ncbi:hypothetical protein J6X15_03860 [Candidatus Saccharibacteria bacterium]|nr:hypothetical protein [Candidatus Saccharibacteria bacterium]MBP5656690.1 hypothetical protein [Candidatus Saccharibacteria bacterium]